MDDDKFNQLKDEIKKAMGKTHLGGIKGEVLHKHLRQMTTDLHFKWIEHKSSDTEKLLKELDSNIGEHLVTKAEDDEHKAVHLLVKNHVYLYLTIHSLLLFEKHDLEEMTETAERFAKFCKKKRVDDETVKKIKDMLLEIGADWKKDFDKFRQELNATWARAKGGQGWSNAFFERMRTEGYFSRLKEKRLFHHAVKDEAAVEKATGKLKQVKSKEELVKAFELAEKKEKEITRDFEVIFKFIFASWDHIEEQNNALLKAVADAVGIHELPHDDVDKMNELHHTITDELDKKYLHDQRIDDSQLESIYSEYVSEVKAIKA